MVNVGEKAGLFPCELIRKGGIMITMIARITRVILVCCMLLSGLSVAEWVNLGGMPGTPPQVTLKGDASNITTVEFRIFGFEREDTTIGGTTYSILSVPGEPTLASEGYPALPYIPRSLIIPDDAHMAVGVTSSTTEMTIPPVLPSRRVMWRNEVADTIPYVFASIYDIGGMYPDEPAGLGRPYILRDFRGSVLMACPFQHDPQSGLLRVHTTMTIDVEPDGPGIINVKTIPRSGHSDPEFIATYQNQFLNYPGGGERNRLNPENGDLLIIAGDGFVGLPALGQFVEWKKKRGYSVFLHSVLELSGTTGEELVEFVATEYTANANIAFAILVGNGDEDISTWPGSNGFHIPYPVDSWTSPDEEFVGAWPADNRCGMVEGDDARPDVMVSRMAAGEEDSGVSIQELGLVINRAVSYERNPYVDPSNNWYQHALFIASFLLDLNGEKDWQCADRAAATMQETGYTPSKLYYDPDSLPGSNPVYPSYVEDELQFTGHSWLVFMGHGEPPVWYHYFSPGGGTSYTVFDRDDVLDLNNWGKLPFVFSVACKTGWIDPLHNPCLAKTWTIAGSGAPFIGGVACFGSSSPQPIIPPKTALEAAVAMINDQNATTVGSICFSGLNAMIDGGTQPGCEEQEYLDRTSETWILFGDCSMQLRTQEPADLYVQHPTHVGTYQASGTVTIPVTVTNLGPNDEVAATLYWCDGQDEVHLVEILDQTQNEAQFQVSAQPARVYDLTVSGFNKFPYEESIILSETYSGYQSGIHRLLGDFLVDADVIVENGNSLSIQSHAGWTNIFFDVDCKVEILEDASIAANGVSLGLAEGEDSWDGLQLTGSGASVNLQNCHVNSAVHGILATSGTSTTIDLVDSYFNNCVSTGIRALYGSHSIAASGVTFNDCHGGIRSDNDPGASWQNTMLTVTNGCLFSGYEKGIELTGPASADISESYFVGNLPDLNWGVILRDDSEGSITDCTFESSRDAFHGIDCRSGTNQITVSDCTIIGPGFDCELPLAFNNYGIFAVGGQSNQPTVRRTSVSDCWYGVSAFGGSVPDLGTSVDLGFNRFNTNCCHVRYAGRSTTPPGGVELFVWGNCWDNEEDPAPDAFCGEWSDYINEDEGNCSYPPDGVPPMPAASLALEVIGPNPFSETVELRLTIPDDTRAAPGTLNIMDVTGRSVRRVHLGTLADGVHHIGWDGRTQQGQPASSGTYLCRIEVDGNVVSQKAVLLRLRD
jgi:hypothetical protein